MLPRVLVTAAAGKTGQAVSRQLMARGYPVRALVRRRDARSERLAVAGAEIMVGSMEDIVQVREALVGVQRAYFCPPLEPGALRKAAIFVAAAEGTVLETLVILSQWLCDPTHPALHAREKWLAGRVFAQMPGVGVVTVNPGFFADNYMAALESIAHFGIMAMPLGTGTNAPPSNEDIARVVVGALANPAGHVGRTYRPTGPHLLTPQDIAETFGSVVGRRVVYHDTPIPLFLKAARALGYDDFTIAQLHWFLQDYQRDSFGVGAPTTAVAEVGGTPPEDFETIVRRYVAASPMARPSPATTLRAVATLVRTLMTPAPRLARIERQLAHPVIGNASLAADSPTWHASHS